MEAEFVKIQLQMHSLRTVMCPDNKRLEIRDEGVQRHKLRAGRVKGLEMMKIFLRQPFLIGFRVVAADVRFLGYAATCGVALNCLTEMTRICLRSRDIFGTITMKTASSETGHLQLKPLRSNFRAETRSSLRRHSCSERSTPTARKAAIPTPHPTL